MKPTFHHKPVNSPFEDPAVYVRVLREGIGLLFDAGDISPLSQRELLKLTHVFISHMHIDHFIGFDTIIRALLRRLEPVALYGPEGIVDCIEGKLKGFTWNLLSQYPLELVVHEVGRENVRKVRYRAQEGFARRDEGIREQAVILLDTDLLTVKGIVLKHDIQTLGFSLEEKMHININKARLIEQGFTVGPWLSDLKRAIRVYDAEALIDTGRGEKKVSELSDLYTMTGGQKISYIMDSSPEDDNIGAITEFISGSDTLYIEAYFSDNEIELARERRHLTAGIAGMIAGNAGVKNLHLLHFSPRYRECPELLIHEAWTHFRR
ncbi:MAG: ribonuclease Z [bacterium]